MKRILATALTVLMILSVMAFASAEDEFIIGFDMYGNQCPYCLKFATYIEELAKEAGMKPIITQADFDVPTQLDNADNMLLQGAKVVAAIWGNKDACLPVIDSCKEYDAVCVSTLTSLSDEGNGYDKYIYLGSENFDGGYLQGQWLAEKAVADEMPQPLKIWYLSSESGDQQCIDRQAGMEQALKDAGIEYEIVAFEYTHNLMDEGLMVMENWAQVYGDEISIVIGSADLSVLGAITAYEAAGYDVEPVTWIGLDGQDVALESIKEGRMDMTVFQNAKAQAVAFIELCQKIRDGEDPAAMEDVNVPFEMITPENVDQYEW